jgi:lipopolysaccharide transport protein LptA
MAHTRPSSRVCLAALVTAGVLGVLAQAPASGVASLEECKGGIKLESDGLDTNFKSNVTELPNVIITGCDARIEARRARATSVDFEDSKWTFEGDVRIHMDQPRGSLKSDRAVVAFRNNQIESVTITGSPAEFEQKRAESNSTARGRAGKIVYDFSTGTVTLSDDAWISDGGGKEIKSAQLLYDISKQAVLGTSKAGDGGERVKITINPRASKQNGGNPSATPPTGQSTPRDTPPAGAAVPAPAPAPAPTTPKP